MKTNGIIQENKWKGYEAKIEKLEQKMEGEKKRETGYVQNYGNKNKVYDQWIRRNEFED